MASVMARSCLSESDGEFKPDSWFGVKVRIMQCGWRQRDLAEALGISEGFLSKLIHGARRTPAWQRAIARKLRVAPAWLWGEFTHPDLR